MSFSRARIAVLSCLLMVASTVAVAAPATAGEPAKVATVSAKTAAKARVIKVRLRAAVKQIPVAGERPRGYDRDKFRHWVDADSDCQDTREEVLVAESRVEIRGCEVSKGRWFSYYDRETWTASGDVDIDHLVPLAEAWRSGARRWNAATRQRYANDLGDPRSLVAVTDNVNQSKSDQDPADWLPDYGVCKYVQQWTAVKLRWRLTANRAEKTELVSLAQDCPNRVLKVRRAKIGKATGGGGGLDPRFDFCYQAVAAGYGPYYRGRDREYAWYTDADSDGVVCE